MGPCRDIERNYERRQEWSSTINTINLAGRLIRRGGELSLFLSLSLSLSEPQRRAAELRESRS